MNSLFLSLLFTLFPAFLKDMPVAWLRLYLGELFAPSVGLEPDEEFGDVHVDLLQEVFDSEDVEEQKDVIFGVGSVVVDVEEGHYNRKVGSGAEYEFDPRVEAAGSPGNATHRINAPGADGPFLPLCRVRSDRRYSLDGF